MIKTYAFVLALVLILLSGCNKINGESAASGLDLAGMDTTVAPQDNFFNYMNGRWLSDTEIPPEQSSWGSFSSLRDQSLEQLKVIVEELSKTPADQLNPSQRTIYNLYHSFIDEQQINALGINPLIEEFEKINALDSLETLGEYLPKAAIKGIDLPIGFWINQDVKNPTAYAIYFSQSGLGLPDRDYYFDESEHGKMIIDQYLAYIAKLLDLAGFKQPVQRAADIYNLEKLLAKNQWTRVENRDRDKTYNPYAVEALETLMGNFPIAHYLEGSNLQGEHQIVVEQPDYFGKLDKIYSETPLETWKNYLYFHLLNSYSAYLSSPFSDANFDFYSKTLRGIKEQKPRWKRSIEFINGATGELLGQLYVEKHFPPEAKQRMKTLVDNLLLAYKNSISDLDWMSSETKHQALDKLAKFTPKIGYPDKWKDYSSLNSQPDNLIANLIAVRQFQHHYETNKLGKPVNRDEWFMPPQIVNAYYNPSMNEIVFPAAILQPPFFNMAADDAVNYGGIGGVIGHEIGHGFDDQGSKSNGDGLLTNWWTDQDRQHFEKRVARLVDQYNQYQPIEGEFINGELTLGENIGDLGGLSIALKAYHLSLQGKKPATLDGFTGEQRVFLGWAQIWRVKLREELTRQLLKTDPHSPSEFRVNGAVRNIDTFYTAFKVKPGDALYLPPKQRVKIW